jgi:hypothetical protein
MEQLFSSTLLLATYFNPNMAINTYITNIDTLNDNFNTYMDNEYVQYIDNYLHNVINYSQTIFNDVSQYISNKL